MQTCMLLLGVDDGSGEHGTSNYQVKVAELQVREGIENNSEIIFLIFQSTHIL